MQPQPAAETRTSPTAAALARLLGGGHLFILLVAIACGLAGAVGAALFRWLIGLFEAFFFGGVDGFVHALGAGIPLEAGEQRDAARGLPRLLLVAIPALGGAIVGPLIWRFAREARGHGIPGVMEAVATRGGVIRPRVAVLKTLASALSIGSGGSVGREGPIVQIGAAIGSAIGQWLRVPSRQLRTIVGCGAAAGVAATFNAPVAGALFAAEVIVGDFAGSRFGPVVVAAVVATVISRAWLGDHAAFPMHGEEFLAGGPLEILCFMALGVLAGAVGVAFTKTLYLTEDVFARIRAPEWSKAALGGLCIGVIALGFPHVMGVGYETIRDALAGNAPALLLAALVVLKIVATSVTLGSGGSGGVFGPSLFIGAMTGGWFGAVLNGALPGTLSASGVYALVAMGAVVASTTHAPLSAIVILLELTQRIDVLPPVMAACVVSTLVARRLSAESIYTMDLLRRGVDIAREEEPNVLKHLFVRDVVDRAPGVVPASATLQQLMVIVANSDHSELFVVNERADLLGVIPFAELRRTLHEQEHLHGLIVAGDIAQLPRATLTEEENLDAVMHLFSSENLEELPVVDRDDARQLIGCVRKRDVIAAYNREVMRRDLARGVSTMVSLVGRGQQVDLGEGLVCEEVLAPADFRGRTLAELDLRARAGVHVMLVRSPSRTAGAIRLPEPSTRIEAGDLLVLAGPKLAVDAIAKS
jgi:CIC family chloride channel protein